MSGEPLELHRLIQSLLGMAGGAHHGQPGLAVKAIAKRLAHELMIIHNQDMDRFIHLVGCSTAFGVTHRVARWANWDI